MPDTNWFKRRGYRHLDYPVNESFAVKVMNPSFVSKHSFSPLIHYLEETTRYKYSQEHKKRVTDKKQRPIKYASHRDACVYSYYSHILTTYLDKKYNELELSNNVIAYRSLGKSNYDFAAEAFAFATVESPVSILAFDVTGFFDNLDHSLLKKRLKEVLNVDELPDHWYKIFKSITRFHFVESDDINNHSVLKSKIAQRSTAHLCSVAELKELDIKIHPNPKPGTGIPQGTPISACLSNLYMLVFDYELKKYCDNIGAMYRRYSDDILIICAPEHAVLVEDFVTEKMLREKLMLNDGKTERAQFDIDSTAKVSGRSAQYLGFTLDIEGVSIRQSSLSRQWRKMRRAVKKTRKIAEAEIAAGRSKKVWTKSLRRRFTPLKFRNFSSYGRRSAKAFGNDQKISGQLRKFEAAVERELAELKKIGK